MLDLAELVSPVLEVHGVELQVEHGTKQLHAHPTGERDQHPVAEVAPVLVAS